MKRWILVATVAILGLGLWQVLFPSGTNLRYEFVRDFGADILNRPVGIAVFGGRIYVTDTGHDRMVVFTSEGAFMGAGGEAGKEPGNFRRPMHLNADIQGNVYVADLLNHRIQKFSSKGKLLRMYGQQGTENGAFMQPGGVAVNQSGELYVVEFEGHRLQKLSPDGAFIRQWGQAGVKGYFSSAFFNYPTDVAVADNGDWFVSDTFNDRVKHYDHEGNLLSVWGGFLGLNTSGSFRGWFKGAYGLDVTPDGQRVFVTDFGNHRVQVFGPDGEFMTTFGQKGKGAGQFAQPTDVAVDENGTVFVVDYANNRIQVWQILEGK